MSGLCARGQDGAGSYSNPLGSARMQGGGAVPPGIQQDQDRNQDFVFTTRRQISMDNTSVNIDLVSLENKNP